MSLSDTSALVLLWSQGAVHTSKDARMYLDGLNLDSGRDLFKKCNRVWGHYDEVIKNRKKCILDVSLQILRDNKIKQMIILGAGFDALSVEILHGTRGLQVYEIDVANMPLKKQLVRKSCNLGSRIHCMDADMKKPGNLISVLKKNGWNNKMPSLLIMEGVSYYLTRKELLGLIDRFKNGGQNRILLEYLLPQNCIAKRKAHIPAKIFNVIKDKHRTPLVRYDKSGIRRLLGPDCTIVRAWGLKEMEVARTGKNLYFKRRSSGWIQVCEVTA